MTKNTAKKEKLGLDINYLYVLLAGLLSLFLLYYVGRMEALIYGVFPINAFLHWHTAMEFITIVISFALFIISYYTYSKNSRVRLLIFSLIFFVIGITDFLHTMNYNGMQGFFGDSSIPKATTFWMLSRLIMSSGLLIAAVIPYNKKTDINRRYLLVVSIAVSICIFYMGTYRTEIFPSFFVPGVGLTKAKIYLEYLIMLAFLCVAALALRDYSITKDKIFIIYSAGLMFAAVTEASFTLYRSVYDTYNLLGHLFKILSSYLIFRAIFLYNLDTPYKHLREARIQLKAYAENLEETVEKRTSEIRNANIKMMEELEYAKLIQQSLLPPKQLTINDIRFISDNFPCHSLSGDLYQFYKIDDKRVGMYIADVSGHGVSAAMLMVFTERLINPAYGAREREGKASPEKSMRLLFNEFNKANFPDEMHIVAFKAIYDTDSRILTYCTGGMNTVPMLVRATGEFILLDKSVGFPICKFDKFYQPEFQEATIALERGDRIIFYTDGLADGFKGSGVLDTADLKQLMESNNNGTARQLEEKLQVEIRRVMNQRSNDDDITYFIMEVA